MSFENFSYKSYIGSIEISLEDNCLYGSILFIRDTVLYNANTIPELRKAFEEAVDDYLVTCTELKKEPNIPSNIINKISHIDEISEFTEDSINYVKQKFNKFEIGKCYEHTSGEQFFILGELNSTMYGNCLVAETNYSNKFKPVGKDEASFVNWVEITKEEWMKNFSE